MRRKALLPIFLVVVPFALALFLIFVWPALRLQRLLAKADEGDIVPALSGYDSATLARELLSERRSERAMQDLVEALASRADPVAADAIVRLARSKDPKLSTMGMSGLRVALIVSEEAQSILVDKLTSETESERIASSIALARVASGDELTRLVREKVSQTADEGKAALVIRAFKDLATSSCRVPSELFLLHVMDERLMIRRVAVQGLAIRHQPKHAIQFVDLLSDTDPEVRLKSYEALKLLLPDCPDFDATAPAGRRQEQATTIRIWMDPRLRELGTQVTAKSVK